MARSSYQCQKKKRRISSNHRSVLCKMPVRPFSDSVLKTRKTSTLRYNLMKIFLIILKISKTILFMCMALINLKAKKLKNYMFAQLWNSQLIKLLDVIIIIKSNIRTLKIISELQWDWLSEEKVLAQLNLNS